jgi:hypothetical protein
MMKKHRRGAVLCAILGVVSARAATLEVGNVNDGGPGSLREAIESALPCDHIVFDEELTGIPVVLTTGELLIDKDLTIAGRGRDETVVDGNGSGRVFHILAGTTVSLADLTVTNGRPQECVGGDSTRSQGGGIYNEGFLRLTRCGITRNEVTYKGSLCDPGGGGRSESVAGAGIYNRGRLTASQSLISGNYCEGWAFCLGGGIYNAGDAVVEETEFTGNSGVIDRWEGLLGSAIYNDASGVATLAGCGLLADEIAAEIENYGQLTLMQNVIAGNGGWRGGGVSNHGVATIVDSSIVGNWSGVGGRAAGLFNEGAATLIRSTISRNTGEYAGGIQNQGTLRLVNSTVAGNEGYWWAGGAYNRGVMSLAASTIAGNTSGQSYGGLKSDGSCLLKGTILAGNANFNSSGTEDCGGQVFSLGQNILGVADQCSAFADGVNGDIAGVDWGLVLENSGSTYGRPRALIDDNLGPTPTIALLPGSPAIDRIPPASCVDDEGIALGGDQRGVVRPQGAACDIGAFEFSAPRGAGFWAHQCSNQAFHQIAAADLQAWLAEIADASSVFPECAPIACEFLLPQVPHNDLRARAQQELLGVRLNLASGRLTWNRPISLAGLTDAATVGDALSELETTVCDPLATRSELGNAKDLAEALDGGPDDMELAAQEGSITVRPGETRTITLGLVNMAEGSRNYGLEVSSAWPVALSATRVDGLGSGAVAEVTAAITAPVAPADPVALIAFKATDLLGQDPLARVVTVTVIVEGDSQLNSQRTRKRR